MVLDLVFAHFSTILGPMDKKIHLWLPPTILSILTALFYAPSLHYAFEFDDVPNILKNYSVRFFPPFTFRTLIENRWMCNWLNKLNYWQGYFDPFYFRLTNLIIHIATGVLVYFLLLSLLSYAPAGTLWHRRRQSIATLTSALFLLHPVQTQTVSYIIQGRSEGVAGLFIVATVLCFVWACSARRRILPIIVLCALCVLTCGAKEIAIVTPLLVLLTDWFVISGQSFAGLKRRWPVHLLVWTIVVSIFALQHDAGFFTKFFTLQQQALQNPGNMLAQAQTIAPLQFAYSSLKVIAHYIAIFLWPFGMSVEYDWQLEPHFFTLGVLLPLAALLVLGFFVLRLAWRKQLPYITFAALWFAIAIAPRASLFASAELVCDYKTYIASVGLLFIVSSGICALPAHALATVVLALGLGTLSMQRNEIWKTPLKFWADVAKHAPRKARGHNNYGVALVEAGEYGQAVLQYKQAIALDAQYADAWNNLAVAYLNLGNQEQALSAQRRGLELNQNHPEAFNNLGTLLLSMGRVRHAQEAFAEALKMRPYYGKACFNMGRACRAQGKHDLALRWYQKATQGDFDTCEMFVEVARLALELGNQEIAKKALDGALARGLDPNAIKYQSPVS